MLSVTSTNTVGDSRPLWRFGNIPLTIELQTKSEWGLTKQAISPIVSSIIICTGEMNDLHWLLDNDAESGYRAKMILLRDEGYTVPKIRRITNHHDNNIRKWIHRSNEKGIDGMYLENMYEMLTRLQKT